MEKISVGEVADRHIISISSGAKVKTALKLLKDSNLSLLPVIENGRLVGLVTEQALMRKELEDNLVREIMEKPFFVEKYKGIDYAIKYLLKNGITKVPIVESSIGMRCIGTVSSSDLLKAKKEAEMCR